MVFPGAAEAELMTTRRAQHHYDRNSSSCCCIDGAAAVEQGMTLGGGAGAQQSRTATCQLDAQLRCGMLDSLFQLKLVQQRNPDAHGEQRRAVERLQGDECIARTRLDRSIPDSARE
jgi:hypothetical protein